MSVRLSITLAALFLGSAAGAAESPMPAPTIPKSTATAPAAASALPMAMLLELAERESPNRQVLAAKRAAAVAAISQARTWSNPELELSVGRAQAREADAGGSRPTTTVGAIGVKQRFELPGKRSARIAAAQAAREAVEGGVAVDHLELTGEVRAAALAVSAADARVVVTRHGVELSTRMQAVVDGHTRAGEGDRGGLARAQVELANARLDADAAAAEAEAARRVLRIWCGTGLPEHFTVAGALADAPPAIDLGLVMGRAAITHPGLPVFAAEQTAGRAAIAAEERAWYPDVTLGVSAARASDTNDFGVSLGIELPLWNRNAGGVARARAELLRSAGEQRREALALKLRITAAWNAYERERRQIAGLTTGVLPAAAEARALMLGAFQAGEASLLEVIDARRVELAGETALAEARVRAAQARLDLFQAAGGETPDDAGSGPPSPTATAPSPAGAQP